MVTDWQMKTTVIYEPTVGRLGPCNLGHYYCLVYLFLRAISSTLFPRHIPVIFRGGGRADILELD